MIFEQIATGGCQSYLVGCTDTCAAALIDPELSQVDRYRRPRRARRACESATSSTRTPMPTISPARASSRGGSSVPVVMHRASPAPFVDMRLDDGEMLVVGNLRLRVHAHARAHAGLDVPDRARTACSPATRCSSAAPDAPTSRPATRRRCTTACSTACSKLDPALAVYPAHDYKGQGHTTIARGDRRESAAAESASRAAFVEMMRSLNLSMPTHLTEALRTNMSGGKTVCAAARRSGGDGAVHVARGAARRASSPARPT